LLGSLEITLALAALLIGATGTFSPCGLSVIDTIGPTGHTGGRRITIAACATFLPGAIAGGVLTFGTLAVTGNLLHGAGGKAAYLVAATLATIAAVLEARGTRIVPQIRRQLPEHWRRVMPMPVAAALYGVLLGIGFTTFVLSFGVWALAGVSLAVGDPKLGLILGACFGLGRAIPVLVLAPLAGSSAGIRATELMCERPGVYTGLRRGDAVALMGAALALVIVPGSAGARSVAALQATDPSATVDSLLFETLAGQGVLQRGGAQAILDGSDPAIGGRYIATVKPDTIQLFSRDNLAPVTQLPAPAVDAVAVSDSWLVYRAALPEGGDGIFVRNIANPAAPSSIASLATVGAPKQLSAPSLDGSVLLFGIASPRGSRIVQQILGTNKHRALVRSHRLLVFSPAVKGKTFAYVRSDARRGRLMVRGRHRHGQGRVLFSLARSAGTLWSTALTENSAYVTILGSGAEHPDARIVALPRRHGKRLHQRGPRGGGNHKY
jgi:hypothetical protein